MGKATTNPKPTSAKAALLTPDPARALLLPGVWIPIALLSASVIAVFWRWFLKQFQPRLPGIDWSFLEPLGGFSWVVPQDWGHAYIVPLISGFALWRERHRIAAIPATIFWPALPIIILGAATYLYFIIMAIHMFQGAALLLTIAGLVLLLQGPGRFGFWVFPLLYLGFAVTISEGVMNKITYRLQDIASQGAWAMLNMLTVETDINGNVLLVHTSTGDPVPLNVAKACSGMRMVVAFIALATAVGWLGCRQWWQRIALVLLGFPVALLMNIMRLAALGVLSLWDPKVAEGQAHMLIGNIILVPGFLLFMFCVWILRKVEPEPGPKGVVA